MKRLVFAAVAGTLLTASLTAPATAQHNDVVVRGHNYGKAGVLFHYAECDNPLATASGQPVGLHRRGGTVGTHAVGYQVDASGRMASTFVPVTKPSKLSVLRASLYSPQAAGEGRVLAYYFDSTAGYRQGFWLGHTAWSYSQNTSWTTLSAGTWSMDQWEYVEDGVVRDTRPGATIADFAESRGGDGRGANIGVSAGCDGNASYLDKFQVGNRRHSTTYDFEGVRSRSFLSLWFADTEKVKRDVRTLQLQLGEERWVGGDSYGLSDGDVEAQYFTGRGILYAKRYGASRFRKVGSGAFDTDGYAWFRLGPNKRTAYRFATKGSQILDSSASRALVVTVRRAVEARITDHNLVQRQRLRFVGTVKPRDRGVRVSLQRRVDGKWRTLSARRTEKGGDFNVSVVVRDVGKWKVRVKVAGAQGNLSTRTRAHTVTVKRYVRPAPPPPGPQEPVDASTPPPADPGPVPPPRKG